MNKIYLPIDNIDDYSGFEVIDSETIRAYKFNGVDYDYTDYFVNSHYISKTGTSPTSCSACIDPSYITSSSYYRNDFDSISNIVFIFVILNMMIVMWFVHSFFRGFGK